MEEQEIDLLELLGVIRRQLPIIILLGLIGGMIAFGISTILPKQYETFTTLIVTRQEGYQSENSDINEIYFNQKLVGTYGELIKSRTVQERVNQELGLDMTYKEFNNKVEVLSVEDTEVMKIVVRDTNPLRAKDIANETAEIFSDIIVDIMKIDNIKVVDYAIESEDHVAPRRMRNTAIGLMLGVLLAIFIAVFRHLTDRTVKSSEEIEEKLGIPVVGNIPIIDKKEK